MKQVLDHLTKSQITIVKKLSEKAGRLANEHRKSGYHCSESVFLALVETMNLKISPAAPKMASGFHGGGGRIGVGEASTPTGCLCGALAGAVLALSVIYGRTSPKITPQSVRVVSASGSVTHYGCCAFASGYLHQRFLTEVGGKCCSMLRPLYQKMDPEKSCQALYRIGAELAVEAMFAAPAVFCECVLPQSLKRLIKETSPIPKRVRRIKETSPA